MTFYDTMTIQYRDKLEPETFIISHRTLQDGWLIANLKYGGQIMVPSDRILSVNVESGEPNDDN